MSPFATTFSTTQVPPAILVKAPVQAVVADAGHGAMALPPTCCQRGIDWRSWNSDIVPRFSKRSEMSSRGGCSDRIRSKSLLVAAVI